MRRIFAINEQPAENGEWVLEAFAKGPGDSEPVRYGLHIDQDGSVVAAPIVSDESQHEASENGMGC